MSSHETIRLLRDDDLLWSPDFNAIRKPLADLLAALERTGSHQLDDEVQALHKALTEGNANASSVEPMEAWIVKSAWAFGVTESGRVVSKKLYEV